MSNISNKIADLRYTHNLNLREFGQKIGVNRTTVGRYENGELKPTLDVMINIHDAFGVSLDWLAGINDAPDALLNYNGVVADARAHGITPEKLQKAVDLLKG